MNQHQKKYALNRIVGLESIKIREAEEKFTTPKVEISREEKYKLISIGKVKLYPIEKVNNNSYSSPDLYPSFDFSAYEKLSVLDQKKFQPIKKEIELIAQKAKDQIMLGDCEEALKLIQKLEDVKV